MDHSLIGVTALRGQAALGDEVVIIGRQGEVEVTADELADLLGTINYEVVTAISQRVPRIVVFGYPVRRRCRGWFLKPTAISGDR